MSDEMEARDLTVVTVGSPLPENAEAWARIEESRLSARMKRALNRIAAGESYRDAAEAEGYATHSDVYRYARQFGLSTVTSARLVEAHRKNALLAADELGRRLEDTPESFKAAELNFITGTATDKVSRYEGWDSRRPESPSYASALERFAETLAKTGARLEITVEPRPDRADAAAVIDVPGGNDETRGG
jgi:hypothetical protein